MTLKLLIAALCCTMLSQGALGQVAANRPVKLMRCSGNHWPARRIVSILDFVEFRIPRLAKLMTIRGGDYMEYLVRYGSEPENLWLRFMFGSAVGGYQPDDLSNTATKWTSRKWGGCDSDEDGTEWTGIGPGGHRWRHIGMPFGFADYRNVPPKQADYFDKILNTMCCGKCPACKKP